jgi:hypothetical protein
VAGIGAAGWRDSPPAGWRLDPPPPPCNPDPLPPWRPEPLDFGSTDSDEDAGAAVATDEADPAAVMGIM